MLCKYPVTIELKKSADALRPCGQCMHCRINNRRVKTHRILLESFEHEHNSFLTLTYSDENLPHEWACPKTGEIYAPSSVSPDHHKTFMDRFRKACKRQFNLDVRYYGVAEYGDISFRPHFHYALFGYPSCPYGGAKYIGNRFVPCLCPTCKFISDHWGKGNIFLGTLTPDSAQYVAGYVTKKLTSNHTDYERSILNQLHPEFPRMSTKPGIGYNSVKRICDLIRANGINTKEDIPKYLNHGNKKLPLGRYLLDKIYTEMEVTTDEYQKFNENERNMFFLFLRQTMATLSSNPTLSKNALASSNLGLAMQYINSQNSLNIEAQTKLYKKETKI